MGQFSGVYVSWGDGGPVVGSDFSEKPLKRQDGTKQGPFSRTLKLWGQSTCPPLLDVGFVGPLNPIGSMYGIYANIGGILMGSMLPYMAAPWILWELHTPWHPHLLHLAAGVFQTPAWRWSLSKALPRIVVFLDIFGNWSNYTDSQATSQRKKAGNWNLRTGGYHMLVDQSCFRKLAKLIDMWKYVDYNFWFMVFTKKIDALIKTHDQVTTLGGLLLAEITENWTRIYSCSIFFRLPVSG